MDADQPLKTLFRLRANDLLPLLGDADADVLFARVVELPAVRRSVDFVLKLRLGRSVYLRHVEFQSRSDPDLPRRLFEYAARLTVQFRLPVLTTVLFVRGPAPRALSYVESVGDRVVHARHFDVLRLWEVDPRAALRLGPGGAALVGPMDKADLTIIREAASRISRGAPPAQQGDLLAVLQMLSEGRYTARQLAGAIPREVMMSSGLWAEARAQGRAEGRAEGVRIARQICVDLARLHHPEVASLIVPAIGACSDPSRLRRWAIRASQTSDAEFVKLVTGPVPRGSVSRTTSRRPRPARRAKASSRR